MKWLIASLLLSTAVPVWAQPGTSKAKEAEPLENSEWNQKICPNGIEEADKLLTLNPYDSKGRCFNYSGRFVQLLNRNQALFSNGFTSDLTPFALIDYGKESVPMEALNVSTLKGLPVYRFYGVVKGKGAYSYQTVSGMLKIVLSFVPVPKSKAREALDRRQEKERKIKEAEVQANAQAKTEQEWKKKIKLLQDQALIDEPLTYSDLSTGLMWTRNGNIIDEMRWDNAMRLVKILDYGGYNDWRLPTKEELDAFAKRGGRFPSKWFNNNGFKNVQDRDYWSSSTTANNTSYAWVVSMGDGDVSPGNKTYGYHFWPVRTGQQVIRP